MADTQDFLDVAIDVPQNGGDFEILPEALYPARLIGFKVAEKPATFLTGEEGEDKQQWVWRFEITGGDFEGVGLNAYTNRSWHPKAKAHQYAAAILGVPELTPEVAVSTKALAGKPCQIYVVEYQNKQGEARNKIQAVRPAPKPRQRVAAAQQPKGADYRVQVAGLPSDDEEIDF